MLGLDEAKAKLKMSWRLGITNGVIMRPNAVLDIELSQKKIIVRELSYVFK